MDRLMQSTCPSQLYVKHGIPSTANHQPTLRLLVRLGANIPPQSESQNGNFTWLTHLCKSTTIRRCIDDIFMTMCPSYPSLSYFTFTIGTYLGQVSRPKLLLVTPSGGDLVREVSPKMPSQKTQVELSPRLVVV